ncbi:MAG: hypothetical protein ACYDHO_01670 [Gaiellaceae bacterium]
MDGQRVAGEGRRGGEGIPAFRTLSSRYLRLAIAATAIAVAVALAVYPLLDASRLGLLVDAMGAAALLSLLLPLLWRGRGAWLPLFLLGAEYVSAESTGHAAAVSVVAYAAGLIVLCELIFWLAELPKAGAVDLSVIARRLLLLALTGIVAAAVAPVALLGTSVRLGSAVAALLLGALAAAALLVIPLLLVLQRGRH